MYGELCIMNLGQSNPTYGATISGDIPAYNFTRRTLFFTGRREDFTMIFASITAYSPQDAEQGHNSLSVSLLAGSRIETFIDLVSVTTRPAALRRKIDVSVEARAAGSTDGRQTLLKAL